MVLRLKSTSRGVCPGAICLDFETAPIQQRPEYPPKPVGLAVGFPGKEPIYCAFDHPVANNATQADAIALLRKAWDSGLPLLFHNAKFDLAVACEGLDMPMPAWDRVHDTMFLAFLCDPHARSLGLKQLAEEWLAWPPEERDAVADWVWEHRAELESAYSKRPTKGKTGEWIWATPADIVAPYAVGDVARTRGLFDYLYPIVRDNGMLQAYDRERQLLPILMENERIGMRVDMEALENDGPLYDDSIFQAETWLRIRLKSPQLNFDADKDVANALLHCGVVARESWKLTESGQLSMSKDNLTPDMFTDPRVASALGYRNRLKTCLEMFMRPWYNQGNQRNGYISTTWNQVRSPGGGTRTGRPSTKDPNFLNISKDFSGRSDGYVHPDFLNVAELPLCRKYLLPDEGHVWLHRDFSNQEIRIFAHFESGALWRQYNAEPGLAVHDWISEEIVRATGRQLEKTRVKNVTFARLYGGGLGAIERQARCASRAEAREIADFHDAALPGRRILVDAIQRVTALGQPIRTWGGRLYYPEENRDYALINYLIQGSAAEITKQSIIDWYGHAGRNARLLTSVYDENNLSCPADDRVRQMSILQESMDADRISVPMRSSGKMGKSWGDLVKCA